MRKQVLQTTSTVLSNLEYCAPKINDATTLVLVTDVGAAPGTFYVYNGSAFVPFNNTSRVTTLTSTAGVLTIDCSLGDYFVYLATEDITSVVIINPPSANYGATKTLKYIQNNSSAKTFVMPTSFMWADGIAGVVSTALDAIDRITFVTDDGGVSWSAEIINDLQNAPI